MIPLEFLIDGIDVRHRIQQLVDLLTHLTLSYLQVQYNLITIVTKLKKISLWQ